MAPLEVGRGLDRKGDEEAGAADERAGQERRERKVMGCIRNVDPLP